MSESDSEREGAPQTPAILTMNDYKVFCSSLKVIGEIFLPTAFLKGNSNTKFKLLIFLRTQLHVNSSPQQFSIGCQTWYDNLENFLTVFDSTGRGLVRIVSDLAPFSLSQ